MESPFGFVVEPEDGSLYKTESAMSLSGMDYSSSMDNGMATNRFGIVVATPSWYIGPISVGSRVIVHHNVFRKFNNYKGQETFSHEFVGNGMYLVNNDQMFGYFSDGNLIMTDDNLMVEPTGDNIGVIAFGGEAGDFGPGQEVVFTPDSEYVFYIDGKKYYKMKSRDICMIKLEKEKSSL